MLKPPVEFLTVDIGGGVVLDGWMLKPSSFDRARKYPVIVFVYGEPAGQTVTRSVGRRRHALPSRARRGRLRRGLVRQPRHAGAEGRRVAQGHLRDRSATCRRRSRRRRSGRSPRGIRSSISIASASGAGAAAARTRSTRCSAFPTSTRSASRSRRCRTSSSTTRSTRSATWACRRTTPRATGVGSPINFAEGLKGKLLLVHGSGDDNVHYQGTERLVNRLVELGKPFDLMVYPNRTHAIAEGPGNDAARLSVDRALLSAAPAAESRAGSPRRNADHFHHRENRVSRGRDHGTRITRITRVNSRRQWARQPGYARLVRGVSTGIRTPPSSPRGVRIPVLTPRTRACGAAGPHGTRSASRQPSVSSANSVVSLDFLRDLRPTPPRAKPTSPASRPRL